MENLDNRNDQERLNDLYSYQILDSSNESGFENLAKLAATICGTRFAQINFLDKVSQWTKACYGMDEKEIPRKLGFCHHTIKRSRLMVVEDTTKDSRFSNKPYVISGPKVRFYAGVNLKSEGNRNIGTICVIGLEPKQLSTNQLDALSVLANEVETRLQLRKKSIELEKKAAFLNNSADLMFIINPETLLIEDVNSEVYQYLNLSADEVIGQSIKAFNPSKQFLSELKLFRSKTNLSKLSIDSFFRSQSKGSYWRVNILKKDGKYYVTTRDITKTKLAEIGVKRSLVEKEIMLKEIHHRVKNNIALISGLLSLEELYTKDENLKEVFLKSQMRIKSMALVHEELYKSKSFSKVSLIKYVDELTDIIKKKFEPNSKNVHLSLEIDRIEFNINQAVPCTLIINELVTNAFKHAFNADVGGLITVRLFSTKNHIKLIVKDNGTGFSEHLRPDDLESLGFQLIKVLSNQLEATMDYKFINGSAFTFTFKKNSVKGSHSNLGKEEEVFLRREFS